MRSEPNYWRTICFVLAAILLLSISVLVMAQDQSPPYGMDNGVWVLKETKPDFGTAEDTEAYFNNKVDVSEFNVKGSLSWGDQKCSGTEWGTSSWDEIPAVLVPGVGQNTTLTAEVGGSQSCAYRHVSARTALYVNEGKQGSEASISYPTSDPKPDPVSVKVPWETPWGKIGDTLTVSVVAQVPAALAMHCSFNYIYAYEAPGSQPAKQNSPVQPKQTDQKTPSQVQGSYAEKCGPCGGSDSGVRFSDLSGQVDLRPDCKENAWKTAEIHTIPCMDDHVRTGEDSSAILSFADMTTFIMKPETEIILDTAVPKDQNIKLVSGNIWENVKKMVRDGQMEVEMSQAVTGIKGTTIVCEEDGSSSTLKVLEGTASFRSKATGEEILVSAGEMATSTENGLSQPQSFDVDAESASWEKLAPMPEGSIKETYTPGKAEGATPLGQSGYYLLKKGYEYYENGSIDEAQKCWEDANETFDKAIASDRSNASYWNGKGCALIDLGGIEKQEEAARAFGVATALDPENAMYWDHMGFALSSVGKPKEALKAYDKAIELDPQNAFIYWAHKGDALMLIEDFDGAAKAYAQYEATAGGIDLREMSERYPSWPLIR